MFSWRKDKYNKEMDEALIYEYPWMHYRPRKKTAIGFAEEFQKDLLSKHIYSNKKEISKWEHFLVHSKQWLTNLKVSSVREIKHLSKPKNLMLRTKRYLRKINGFLLTVGSILFTMISDPEENNGKAQSSKGPVYGLLLLDILADSVRSEDLIRKYERDLYNSQLPDKCSDCGGTFYHRWRHPVHKDLHYICHLIEREF